MKYLWEDGTASRHRKQTRLFAGYHFQTSLAFTPIEPYLSPSMLASELSSISAFTYSLLFGLYSLPSHVILFAIIFLVDIVDKRPIAKKNTHTHTVDALSVFFLPWFSG